VSSSFHASSDVLEPHFKSEIGYRPLMGYAIEFVTNPSQMTVRSVHVNTGRLESELVYHDKGLSLRDCVSRSQNPSRSPNMPRLEWIEDALALIEGSPCQIHGVATSNLSCEVSKTTLWSSLNRHWLLSPFGGIKLSRSVACG
jgi:hypothetical protein